MEIQLEIAEDTSQFGEKYIYLALNLPMLEYTETIKRIFSSNIETINTVGNVLFTEKVVEFYYARKNYKENICDSLNNKIIAIGSLSNMDDVLDYNYYPYAIMSNTLMWDMRQLYKICQNMMNEISDTSTVRFYVFYLKIALNHLPNL